MNARQLYYTFESKRRLTENPTCHCAAGRDRERFAVRRVTGCRSAAGHEDTDIQGSTEEGVAQTPVSMGI